MFLFFKNILNGGPTNYLMLQFAPTFLCIFPGALGPYSWKKAPLLTRKANGSMSLPIIQSLKTLNFYMTELRASWRELELIAKNCSSLVSLKISECDISYLVRFFRAATVLEEFGGGSFDVK